jgi:hypothetical protein
MNKKNLLRKLASNQKNVRFSDALIIAESVGFQLKRVSGSHHILAKPEIAELLNFQEVNGQAKPYQVKQLVKLIEKYDLQIEE